MKHSRPQSLSIINKTAILNFLRTEGPASRTDISRALGISFPTTSANVKALIESGIVTESDEHDKALGRKSKLLIYNAKRGYVIGGEIGRRSILVILSDLKGNALDEITIDLDDGIFTKKTLIELDRRIDQMLQKEGIGPDRVFSACIGVPYRIDSTSRSNFLNFLSGDLKGTQLDRYFDLKFDTTVRVENSINLGVLGEKSYGVAKNHRNIFYIDYGVGIGSALVLNDKLFHGHNGAVGEISYSISDTNRLRSSYSDNGLLEELISSAAEDAGLRPDENKHIHEMKSVFDRALQGEKDALTFLDLVAQYFGVLLVNAVSLLNPEIVIFSGGVGIHLLERYNPAFSDMLSAHVPYVPKLLPSSLNKRGSSLGAVSVALEHLHSDYAVLEKAIQETHHASI